MFHQLLNLVAGTLNSGIVIHVTTSFLLYGCFSGCCSSSRMLALTIVLDEERIFHLVLKPHFCFFLDFILQFFLAFVFFVEGSTQVCELDCNHQVENKKRSKNDCKEKEKVKSKCFLSITNNVHHICPALQCDNLEDIHD